MMKSIDKRIKSLQLSKTYRVLILSVGKCRFLNVGKCRRLKFFHDAYSFQLPQFYALPQLEPTVYASTESCFALTISTRLSLFDYYFMRVNRCCVIRCTSERCCMSEVINGRRENATSCSAAAMSHHKPPSPSLHHCSGFSPC